jgi:membrane protein implicated in regulation of membrane protease activity
MLDDWHYWILAMLFLFIAEAFIPGMVLGSLGIGALAGALACAFTGSWELQVFSASAGTLFAFFALRPLAMRRWFSGSPTAIGIEALVGRRAVVTQAYDASSQRLRVKLDGDDWLAELGCEDTENMNNPEKLAVGTAVIINAVESNVLTVCPAPNASNQ